MRVGVLSHNLSHRQTVHTILTAKTDFPFRFTLSRGGGRTHDHHTGFLSCGPHKPLSVWLELGAGVEKAAKS